MRLENLSVKEGVHFYCFKQNFETCVRLTNEFAQSNLQMYNFSILLL